MSVLVLVMGDYPDSSSLYIFTKCECNVSGNIFFHITHIQHSLAMVVIILLLVFLVLNGMPTTDSTYEYFKFVQQWPKTYCDGHWPPCTEPLVNYFTIHGLWPANNSGTRPVENCLGKSYNRAVMKKLNSQLSKDWPNLSGGDESFWDYQWKKHGMCSEMNFSQRDYFQLAMDNKKKMDLMSILAGSKIFPDPIKWYSGQSISSAIKNKTGYEPELNCRKDNNNNNIKYLKEIRICLEANGLQYKKCYYGGNCGPKIIWPTI